MKNIKTISAIFLTLLLLLGMAACSETPAGTPTAKEITVSIVYGDKTNDTLVINTEAQYLAEALVDEGIIEYREDGYYTTIKGVTADYSADQAWWQLTKDGVMTTEGLNTQPIADGDRYKITYTIG